MVDLDAFFGAISMVVLDFSYGLWFVGKLIFSAAVIDKKSSCILQNKCKHANVTYPLTWILTLAVIPSHQDAKILSARCQVCCTSRLVLHYLLHLLNFVSFCILGITIWRHLYMQNAIEHNVATVAEAMLTIAGLPEGTQGHNALALAAQYCHVVADCCVRVTPRAP